QHRRRNVQEQRRCGRAGRQDKNASALLDDEEAVAAVTRIGHVKRTREPLHDRDEADRRLRLAVEREQREQQEQQPRGQVESSLQAHGRVLWWLVSSADGRKRFDTRTLRGARRANPPAEVRARGQASEPCW